MSVSVSRFRKAYPEFNATPDELCSQKLAAAELRIDPTVWGARETQGVMLLAAHLLSISPQGQKSRYVGQDYMSPYEREWRQMVREVTLGIGRLS